MSFRALAWCCLTACVSAGPAVEFNRDVRPILSDKCYQCHGPDAVAKKIPLRLDSEAAVKQKVIVPGKPEESELIRRITATSAAKRMPPAYAGVKLTEPEIATLTEWVAQGAPWQKHWSFLPPLRADVPEGVHPVDYFVQKQLKKQGLAPSPEASRETLIRRVSLDLTGIPPTPAEVDAFVRDQSPTAYEKIVNRLLASPRYAERMAARWLDAARYADSNGYQYDGERVMWRWRDWVINAFDRNQPFDQFALEQIAGDLLPNATREQKIATGFNRNHRSNTEDGIIPEEYAVEYVADRVETTSTVFLGLTLGCARCHNHKYDPFTQKEFYQVFAYFNNIPELGRAMKYGNSPPVVQAPTPEQQAKLAEMQKRIDILQESFTAKRDRLDGELGAWRKQLSAGDEAHWAPRAGLNAEFRGPANPTTAAGKGAFDIEERFTLSAWIYSDDTPDGSIVTRMADKPQGKGYGLHADKGRVHVNFTSNYADDAIRIESEDVLAPHQWHHVAMSYTGSRMADGITLYIDGKPARTKVLLDTLYRPFRNAGSKFQEPLRVGAGWGPGRHFTGKIEDVLVYSRVLSADEIETLALRESVGEIAAKAQPSKAETNALRWYYLTHAAAREVREDWTRLQNLQFEKEAFERTFPTVMVMAERNPPKDTFLLVRGAYDKPGEKVTPGVPAVLPHLPEDAPSNRLGFARWLVGPNNPLLARVTMNRFWQMYFGTGLVKTTEDFGSQGEWPSNPELLDWLATEFVRTGWDVKAMQKLIVTSATYRQSAKAAPELLQHDPENRLLARGPRFRLSAEMVRDQALAAAGLLVEKAGGPSVKPYQPAGLWKETSMQDMDYVQSHGPDLYRRSMYTFWKRTIAPPMMVNFDAANRESCVVREARTNTPLQALNLMNDVTFLEAARFIGQRMIQEGGADADARLRYGYKLVLAREPDARELEVLRASLQYHRDYFADEARAVHYLEPGETRPDPSLAPRELAAYAAVGSLILNLDEAVTKP